MLTADIIWPSTSPWASPVVLVGKKDGDVRFCVDYRKLNQLAKFDAYPMPRVEEIFKAPATFQRTMNHVLRDCRGFSGAYIDDIVVFSESWEEHIQHLREVFTQLEKAGFTVKFQLACI